MPFLDNNISAGIPKGGKVEAGRVNYDNGTLIESGALLPWPVDPEVTYFYYNCTVGVMLDSGVVVHNQLPQVNRAPDTLSSTFIEDLKQSTLTKVGVNLNCQDQYQDIVQRMGHSRYWFRLWGQALRIGYKVPIPGLKSVGGAKAIPYDRNPQWAYNTIVPGANYGGVPLWLGVWSLWYTIATPPVRDDIPVVDPSGHITGETPLPKIDGIQAPYSQMDDNAKPITLGKFVQT